MKAADNNAADPQVWSNDRRHCGSRFHEGFVQYLGFAPKTKEIKILSAPTAKNKFEGTHTAAPGFYISIADLEDEDKKVDEENQTRRRTKIKIHFEVWKTRR